MKLYWESNSRVKFLVETGKIEPDSVIKKTQTHKFPVEAATVRMHRVRDKHPVVSLHIRGNAQTYGLGSAPTCRVNFGGEWGGKVNPAMDSN